MNLVVCTHSKNSRSHVVLDKNTKKDSQWIEQYKVKHFPVDRLNYLGIACIYLEILQTSKQETLSHYLIDEYIDKWLPEAFEARKKVNWYIEQLYQQVLQGDEDESKLIGGI